MQKNDQKKGEMPLINKILLAGFVVWALVYSYMKLGKEYPEGFAIAVLAIALGITLGLLIGKKIKSSIVSKK